MRSGESIVLVAAFKVGHLHRYRARTAVIRLGAELCESSLGVL